jgi:hypothetical protein
MISKYGSTVYLNWVREVIGRKIIQDGKLLDTN